MWKLFCEDTPKSDKHTILSGSFVSCIRSVYFQGILYYAEFCVYLQDAWTENYILPWVTAFLYLKKVGIDL